MMGVPCRRPLCFDRRMLAADIKKRMIEAMKAKRDLERDILRVALGEIQNAENRGQVVTDDEAAKIIRKLIKSNSETLASAGERAELKTKLEEENKILESLLPQQWSIDRIVQELAGLADQIKAAKSEGQATGVAMKHLKSQGAPVEGKDVGEAVKKIRS